MADLKIAKIDAASYSKFLSDNPPQDPFSLPAFLDAYEEIFSSDVELLSIVKKETPIAVCALFAGKRFSQPIIRLMPVRTYDGVHFRGLEGSKNQKQEYEKLLSLQVLEEYLEKNFSFHQMVFQPGFADIRAFQWAGAKIIPQYTYVVDIHKFSEDNYTKSLKEVLRTAEHSGLHRGKCSIEELTVLQQLSYERHGRTPPVPTEKLNRVLNKLDSAGLLEITCVRSGSDEILAGLAALQTETGSYFYVSGIRLGRTEGEKGASHFLYHEILKSEKQSGRSFVDFCGANTPSINLFKSAFGPRLDVYFRVWRANRPLTRLASAVKKI